MKRKTTKGILRIWIALGIFLTFAGPMLLIATAERMWGMFWIFFFPILIAIGAFLLRWVLRAFEDENDALREYHRERAAQLYLKMLNSDDPEAMLKESLNQSRHTNEPKSKEDSDEQGFTPNDREADD